MGSTIHRIIGDSLFYYNQNDSTWIHLRNDESEFDENGLIVRKKSRPPYTIFVEEIWEREENGQIISYTHLGGDVNSDTIFQSDSYQRTYTLDEQGFVIADSRFYPIGRNTENRTYENYCDGKVKLEHYENLMVTSFPTRTYYEYRKAADECNKKKESNILHIYPNPTDGIIQLETDVFQESSAQIKVYTLLGQLAYQENFPNQGSRTTLYLSHLEAGNYIVYVVSNKLHAVEKIVIKPH